MPYSPNARSIQPDPVMTNVMQDNSGLGGWLAPILCPVKTVSKDYIRWAKQDSKTLLQAFERTLSAPGARAMLLNQPVKTWFTSVVQEDAVRVEYTVDDIMNSSSPEVPRVNGAKKMLNVLQYMIEALVAALYDPSTFAAANKAAAGGAWATTTCTALADVETAKAVVAERAGVEPNYIRIPRKKWAGLIASDAISKNVQGIFAQMIAESITFGRPNTFLGLKLLMSTARRDATYTGALTPGFIWDQGNHATTAIVGYSPTLDGQEWNGEDQTLAMQFQNNLNGTPFDPVEYPDPNFPETKKYIATSSIRRSVPEVLNPEVAYAITGI